MGNEAFLEECSRCEKEEKMNNTERMLYDAAVEGNALALLRLLEEDRLALDRVVSGCFSETPMHVAAMLGHVEFVREILTRNPEMTGEVDYRRSTPLHLAAAKGHIEVVKLLSLTNPETCLSRDWEGRSPAHLAVIKGHIQVLKELVRVKPEMAWLKVRSGNILHLCVRHYQHEALEWLVETMGDDHEFMNLKDDHGSTILHLAAAYQQVEVVKLLLTKSQVKVNVVNHHGFTALDTALAQGCATEKDVRIQELLKQYGAVQATTKSLCRTGSVVVNARDEPLEEKSRQQKGKKTKTQDWLEQRRAPIMVVASLIASMAFQAGLNPPIMNMPRGETTWKIDFDFILLNGASLNASIFVILLMISGLPWTGRLFTWLLMIVMWVALITILLTYRCLEMIWLRHIGIRDKHVTNGSLWQTLISVLLIGHTVQLVPIFRRWIKKQRSHPDPI